MISRLGSWFKEVRHSIGQQYSGKALITTLGNDARHMMTLIAVSVVTRSAGSTILVIVCISVATMIGRSIGAAIYVAKLETPTTAGE